MPTTVNGIGTHYYGRKDASAVQGTCAFCKRFTTLSSYETREWMCFVYIPIVPLRRYRILNDCRICRRHHRLPLEQFQQRLEAEVAPLRAAVARSPLDPAAHLALVQGLIGYQLFPEAESAAREGLAKAPNDAMLNRLMAHLLAVRGQLAEATPYYRRAALAATGDGEIRLAFGRHLFLRGEMAEATHELAEAWKRDPGNRLALQLMGDSLFAQQRWTEALDAYQQVLVRHPEEGSNRELLRQMKAAKEALGFPLTDAERKAGRRWWPFGGKKKLTTLRPARQVDGRRIALLLGGVLGLIALGTVGMAFWKQRSADVWFDNGLAKGVRITLDGETFPLAMRATEKKTVRPGVHAIRVADWKGAEMERFEATVPKLDLFDALTTDRLFVFNVAAARIYQREEFGYAASEENRSYRVSYVAFQRFFEQRDVDYAFTPAPQTLQVDSKTSSTRKVAFNPTPLDANQLGVVWFNEGKRQDAEKAFRRALAGEPCSVPAHRNLLSVLPAAEQVAAAREWVAACPGVEAERSYQQARLDRGEREPLLAEYQARLAAHPEAGANHYLYARLLQDPEQSIPHYRQAIALDPDLSWSRVALAHDLLALERDGEALEALEPVLRRPDRDPSVVEIYGMAAIGAGAFDRARGMLDQVEKAEGGEDESLWAARWRLYLASGDFDRAAKVLQGRRMAGGEGDPALWVFEVQLLRARGDAQGLKRRLAEGRLRQELAGLAGTFLTESALAEGKWRAAATALEGLKPDEVTYPDRILAAWGLQMAGERQGAEERLAAIERELLPHAAGDAPSAAYLAMAQHLLGRAPGEAVLAASRRAGFQLVPLAYFVLGAAREGAGDAAGARPLYEKARQRALDLNLPLYAAAARAKGGVPAG